MQLSLNCSLCYRKGMEYATDTYRNVMETRQVPKLLKGHWKIRDLAAPEYEAGREKGVAPLRAILMLVPEIHTAS